jgi:hypothetical protein
VTVPKTQFSVHNRISENGISRNYIIREPL